MPFHLQLSERGDLRAFEVRIMVEIDADTLAELMVKLLVEVSKAYEMKITDVRISERLTRHNGPDELPF